MHKVTFLVAACTVAAALAACGGGSAGKSPNPVAKSPVSDSSATTPPGSGDASSSPQGKPIGEIRVANLIMINGVPGPAIDLYDILHATPKDEPVIKGLKYGEISDYVGPRTAGPRSFLFIYPAGKLASADGLQAGNITQSGYRPGDQFTIGITNGYLAQLQIAEAGPSKSPALDVSAPADKALLIAESAVEAAAGQTQYFMVDGSCPPARSYSGATIDRPVLGRGETPIVVSPGSHTIGLVVAPAGPFSSCSALKPVVTAKISVSAGQRVDVFAYGDPSKPELLSAPVTR